MAVYRRAYRPYAGALTAHWSRFLILPRYALKTLFRSKILTSYFVLCFFPALVAGVIIYLYNSPLVQVALGMRGDMKELPWGIDARFFFTLLRVQCGMAFLLVAWVGPTLVAPDLANNALPLYLSRPFSRVEYVLGKAAVLVGVVSAVTWVPDLLLYSLHGGMAGGGWLWKHLHIAYAIVTGSLLWIAVLSLLALAISAWLRWRIAASGLMVGIFFVAAGFGEAVNQIMRTYWGRAFNISYLMQTVWLDLFNLPSLSRASRMSFGDPRLTDIPVGVAWAVLLGLCFICILLLNRRLRAREVVRG